LHFYIMSVNALLKHILLFIMYERNSNRNANTSACGLDGTR
jgi:hypothetical protein